VAKVQKERKKERKKEREKRGRKERIFGLIGVMLLYGG